MLLSEILESSACKDRSGSTTVDGFDRRRSQLIDMVLKMGHERILSMFVSSPDPCFLRLVSKLSRNGSVQGTFTVQVRNARRFGDEIVMLRESSSWSVRRQVRGSSSSHICSASPDLPIPEFGDMPCPYPERSLRRTPSLNTRVRSTADFYTLSM